MISRAFCGETTALESIFRQCRAARVNGNVLGSEPLLLVLLVKHTAQINKEVARRVEEDFRADGVNLLSSTTTFEMGINIGDLQKVLLRNAPPTSASYVQRVGRAGRGKDKNSVCVTVCRRTKYDADAWREPERLMSGTIRPPTVFLKNRLITSLKWKSSEQGFSSALGSRFAFMAILTGQAPCP